MARTTVMMHVVECNGEHQFTKRPLLNGRSFLHVLNCGYVTGAAAQSQKPKNVIGQSQ